MLHNLTATDLSAHREYLLRFARRRLHDQALAEDVVHDVLAAVLAGGAAFEHRSSLRTWLVGILKHKIVDAVRARTAECSLDALVEDGAAWPDLQAVEPSQRAEQRQHLAHALAHIGALPAPLRRAFELRVLLGHSSAEVCHALAITPGNLWVRLHRARKSLALGGLTPPAAG
jgi:RNA polymerase sigma-70 factor, ECF subfamily